MQRELSVIKIMKTNDDGTVSGKWLYDCRATLEKAQQYAEQTRAWEQAILDKATEITGIPHTYEVAVVERFKPTDDPDFDFGFNLTIAR